MSRFAAILILVLMAAPAGADEHLPAPPEQDGFALIEEGAKLLLQGLLAELGPAWEELRGLFDDLNAYHPPEVLPNGDILIRRKVDEDGVTEL